MAHKSRVSLAPLCRATSFGKPTEAAVRPRPACCCWAMVFSTAAVDSTSWALSIRLSPDEVFM